VTLDARLPRLFSRGPANVVAVQRRTQEGAQRRIRSCVCNARLGGSRPWSQSKRPPLPACTWERAPGPPPHRQVGKFSQGRILLDDATKLNRADFNGLVGRATQKLPPSISLVVCDEQNGLVALQYPHSGRRDGTRCIFEGPVFGHELLLMVAVRPTAWPFSGLAQSVSEDQVRCNGRLGGVQVRRLFRSLRPTVKAHQKEAAAAIHAGKTRTAHEMTERRRPRSDR
jgi:hypothetical protein